MSTVESGELRLQLQTTTEGWVTTGSLHWESSDPAAVVLLVHDPVREQDVRWTFARSLFVVPFALPGRSIGFEGADVNTCFVPPWFHVHLRSPEGEATVLLDPQDVSHFVMQTAEIVGVGTDAESAAYGAGIDEELIDLLGGESS